MIITKPFSPINYVRIHLVVCQNIGSCFNTNLLSKYSKTEFSQKHQGYRKANEDPWQCWYHGNISYGGSSWVWQGLVHPQGIANIQSLAKLRKHTNHFDSKNGKKIVVHKKNGTSNSQKEDCIFWKSMKTRTQYLIMWSRWKMDTHKWTNQEQF